MLSFLKRRFKHPTNPALAQYRRGPTFTPGAMNMAYESRTGNPVVLLKGPGMYCGTLAVTQPIPVNQALALMTEPQQGYPVGSMYYAGLLAEEPSSDAS